MIRIQVSCASGEDEGWEAFDELKDKEFRNWSGEGHKRFQHGFIEFEDLATFLLWFASAECRATCELAEPGEDHQFELFFGDAYD